jgi:hypothetical protein
MLLLLKVAQETPAGNAELAIWQIKYGLLSKKICYMAMELQKGGQIFLG